MSNPGCLIGIIIMVYEVIFIYHINLVVFHPLYLEPKESVCFFHQHKNHSFKNQFGPFEVVSIKLIRINCTQKSSGTLGTFDLDPGLISFWSAICVDAQEPKKNNQNSTTLMRKQTNTMT